MADTKKQPVAIWAQGGLFLSVMILPTLIFAAGAAKLSYDRFRSVGWAIIAFIFPALYYMYYAFAISVPVAPVMVAAARRLHGF
jgi:hypothetical protein